MLLEYEYYILRLLFELSKPPRKIFADVKKNEVLRRESKAVKPFSIDFPLLLLNEGNSEIQMKNLEKMSMA
jgi:hypothetical protein